MGHIIKVMNIKNKKRQAGEEVARDGIKSSLSDLNPA
jgi:hypothetical protein